MREEIFVFITSSKTVLVPTRLPRTRNSSPEQRRTESDANNSILSSAVIKNACGWTSTPPERFRCMVLGNRGILIFVLSWCLGRLTSSLPNKGVTPSGRWVSWQQGGACCAACNFCSILVFASPLVGSLRTTAVRATVAQARCKWKKKTRMKEMKGKERKKGEREMRIGNVKKEGRDEWKEKKNNLFANERNWKEKWKKAISTKDDKGVEWK